jgi:hypothetical protein
VRITLLACFAVLIAALSVPGISAQEITKSGEFSVVRLSSTDLANLVGKIESIARTANGGDSATRVHEELVLQDGATSLGLTEDLSPKAISNGLPVAYSVDYDYGSSGTAISRVQLQFNDYRRSVSVSGHSREQVEALFSAISSDVGAYERTFGGGMFRAIAGPFILVGGLLLILLPVASYTSRNRIPLAVLGFIVALCPLLLPWQKILPGAAIYSGDTSFIVRQAPLISFLGFVVTVAAFVYSLFARPERSKNDSPMSGGAGRAKVARRRKTSVRAIRPSGRRGFESPRVHSPIWGEGHGEKRQRLTSPSLGLMSRFILFRWLPLASTGLPGVTIPHEYD